MKALKKVYTLLNIFLYVLSYLTICYVLNLDLLKQTNLSLFV
jgi:hypothetical protein